MRPIAHIGEVTGDYKVLAKIDNKYLFKCIKCGEEKLVCKQTFYRNPRCQKCGGRKNAVRFKYEGKLVSAKEISKKTGLSIHHIYKKGVRND